MKTTRLQAGEYTYRGFVIEDHGAGGSLHARMTHASGRWRASPINPDEAPPLRWKAHYTLRAAKKEIDFAYKRAEFRASLDTPAFPR